MVWNNMRWTAKTPSAVIVMNFSGKGILAWKNSERNKPYITVEHVADFKGEEKALQTGQKDHRYMLRLTL